MKLFSQARQLFKKLFSRKKAERERFSVAVKPPKKTRRDIFRKKKRAVKSKRPLERRGVVLMRQYGNGEYEIRHFVKFFGNFRPRKKLPKFINVGQNNARSVEHRDKFR